jgi:hypothetical protein
MDVDFYISYQSLSQDELIEIILAAKDYQPEAVIAAKQIIIEKNWTRELQDALQLQKQKDAELQKAYEEDVIKKAQYYRDVLEYKKQNNRIQIRIADIPKLEGALNENGIQFFREDKNIGTVLETYPTETYFFKEGDLLKVDEIMRDQNIAANAYIDLKPFWKFQVKAYVIIVLVILLFFMLAYTFFPHSTTHR